MQWKRERESQSLAELSGLTSHDREVGQEIIVKTPEKENEALQTNAGGSTSDATSQFSNAFPTFNSIHCYDTNTSLFMFIYSIASPNNDSLDPIRSIERSA